MKNISTFSAEAQRYDSGSILCEAGMQGLGSLALFYSPRQTCAGFGLLIRLYEDQSFGQGQYFLWLSHHLSRHPPQICSSVAVCSPPDPSTKDTPPLYSESKEVVEERSVHTVIKKLQVKEGKTSLNGNFCTSRLRMIELSGIKKSVIN